jgi:hypothetical protein
MAEASSHNATEAGVEHVLLALCGGPSIASEVLREVGVTRELIELELPGLAPRTPAGTAQAQQTAAGLRGDGERLHGCALGLATAWGERPGSAHYLLAIAYCGYGHLFSVLGTSSAAVVNALRRHGARVPDGEPPEYRPFRGPREVEVSEQELEPLLNVLKRMHPPGSEWRWGFVGTQGEPSRAQVTAEEGIDLEAALRESRSQ